MFPIFTIGHSNLELTVFVAALRQHSVDAIADVRSNPRSHRFPQFSQPDFEQSLRQAGMRYIFLGEELGGRPDDPKAYRADGMVNYRARRKSFAFGQGIERVLRELEVRSLALVCAEEDPLECHRFLMICPELVVTGVNIFHIRRGGAVETQQHAEDRLLSALKFNANRSDSLFASDRKMALEDAYAEHAKIHAFRTDPTLIQDW